MKGREICFELDIELTNTKGQILASKMAISV